MQYPGALSRQGLGTDGKVGLGCFRMCPCVLVLCLLCRAKSRGLFSGEVVCPSHEAGGDVCHTVSEEADPFCLWVCTRIYCIVERCETKSISRDGHQGGACGGH